MPGGKKQSEKQKGKPKVKPRGEKPLEKILQRLEAEGSCLKFLAQMAYVSISTYLHQRKLVAEGAMKRVRINDHLSFHTFNKETRWGKKLSDLMEGITEAISLKYLRQAILMVNEDTSRPDSATEVFSISVAYTEGECFKIVDKDGCQIASLSWKGEGHFAEQLDSVIHKLVYAIRRLEPFGERKPHPIVKLTYYDRAPLNYEPMGFSRCTDTFTFDGRPQRVDLGQLSTRFGTVVFDIQSTYIKDSERIQKAKSMAYEIEDFERHSGSLTQNYTLLNTTHMSVEKSRIEEPDVITIKSSIDKQDVIEMVDDVMRVDASMSSSPKSAQSNRSEANGKESSAKKSSRSEASSEEPSVEKSPPPVPKRVTRAAAQKEKEKKLKHKPIEKKKTKKKVASRHVSFTPTGKSSIRSKAPEHHFQKISLFDRKISMSASDRDDYGRN